MLPRQPSMPRLASAFTASSSGWRLCDRSMRRSPRPVPRTGASASRRCATCAAASGREPEFPDGCAATTTSSTQQFACPRADMKILRHSRIRHTQHHAGRPTVAPQRKMGPPPPRTARRPQGRRPVAVPPRRRRRARTQRRSRGLTCKRAIEDWGAGLPAGEFRALVARTRPPTEPLPPDTSERAQP